MLAQNFMTPKELKICDIEFVALVTVLGMLEREEIPEDAFNMSGYYWDCGTPSCMCGWANHVSNNHAFPMIRTGLDAPGSRGPDIALMSRELRNLFMIDFDIYCADINPQCVTREQSAMALRSFLTTGRANWQEVMKGQPHGKFHDCCPLSL